jgi:hypothetical protein
VRTMRGGPIRSFEREPLNRRLCMNTLGGTYTA